MFGILVVVASGLTAVAVALQLVAHALAVVK